MKMPRLIAFRKKNELTQRELAEKVGIDSTSISRLENELQRGESPTCPGHLEVVSEALDVDPEEALNMVELEVKISEC